MEVNGKSSCQRPGDGGVLSRVRGALQESGRWLEGGRVPWLPSASRRSTSRFIRSLRLNYGERADRRSGSIELFPIMEASLDGAKG